MSLPKYNGEPMTLPELIVLIGLVMLGIFTVVFLAPIVISWATTDGSIFAVIILIICAGFAGEMALIALTIVCYPFIKLYQWTKAYIGYKNHFVDENGNQTTARQRRNLRRKHLQEEYKNAHK